ncbi:MAG: S-layer homology domain-containing protein [Armatimonadota bacterium]
MRTALLVVVSLALVLALPCVGQAATYVLSDFESDADLAQWAPTGAVVHCPDGWCEDDPATLTRVPSHATSGSYSCQITMPPVDFPGITMVSFPTTEWSPYDVLCMDLDNPTPGALLLHVELSDSVAGSGWAKRFYTEMALIPGINHIEVDLHNLPRNDGMGNVDTAHIGRFLFYVTGFSTQTDVYVDHVRLETIEDDPWADAARGIYKFDFGTASSARWRDFFRVTASDAYAAVPGWGWTDSSYRYSGDNAGPDDLCRDYVRPLPCCPTSDPMEFRLDLPNGSYTVYIIARSGELHGMPVLPWQIAAEGVPKVDVPMDSATFYSADYYYRGMDEDYPLSTSFFEKFEEANYPAYQFTTAVSDGALDLSISRAWVFMLVVYPTSLEAEMGPRLAGWEADRRTQFESTYYVSAPADRTFTPTPEETARGFAAWPVAAMDPCYPDTLPPDPRPELALATAAAQDERRPVNLAIRPIGDVTDVSISVSDLSDGDGHTIAASEIEPNYVRYMVTPDVEFFGSGVLTWKPRLLQSDFPISVRAQVTKQFWLEVHVPNGTPAGTYTGTVTVHASSGELSVPLTVEVWSFQLDRADEMAYGWYYMSPEDRYCFNTLWFPDMVGAADEMLRTDLADMRKHGYNSLQIPGPYLEGIDPDTGFPAAVNLSQRSRYVSAMQDTGFGGDWKGQLGTIDVANQILGSSSVTEFDSSFDAAFGTVLDSIVGANQNDGYEFAAYLVDEPRESMIAPWNRNFADTMQYCGLANAADGLASTVTVMADSQEGVDYTPIADSTDIVQTHPWPNSEGLIQHALDQGKPIWFYNTGGDLRMVYGFYQYKWGNGCWEWHYDWLDEGFDAFPYSPYNNHWHYTYPSPDGPVPTLKYEWGSLGIMDYRYAATLQRLSQESRATGLPELVEWADRADALLAEIRADVPDYAVDESYAPYHFAGIAEGPGCLTQVDTALDDYRRRIGELIAELSGPIPGAECEVVSVNLPDSMVWNERAPAAVEVRNVGAATWVAEGYEYQLLPTPASGDWAASPVMLEDTAPGESWLSEFEVWAPALTTLRYEVGVTPTGPAQTGALRCDYQLTKGDAPVPGGLAQHEIVVSRFPDIQSGTASAWARTEIEECAGRVPFIVLGYEDGLYHGELTVSRAAMAVFMARAADYTLDDVAAPPFPDVPLGYWAEREIQACVQNGVVKGYPDGIYRPEVTITRDQMAAFIQRACGYELPELSDDPFPDVPDHFWAAREIQACVDHEVVKGYPDGFYRPEWEVTRDQMAVFVYRAFIEPHGAVVVLGGPGITWPGLSAEVLRPGEAPSYAWSYTNTGPRGNPGTAFVVLDAERLDRSLGEESEFGVTFRLRDDQGTLVGEQRVLLGAEAIADARAAVASSGGLPYLTLSWELPHDALEVGFYYLEVGTADGRPVLQEPVELAVWDPPVWPTSAR